MSNGVGGADPCALSRTTTVERKNSNNFHDEGMTSTCPAMEKGGSHTLTTQENRDKKKHQQITGHTYFSPIILWQDARLI